MIPNDAIFVTVLLFFAPLSSSWFWKWIGWEDIADGSGYLKNPMENIKFEGDEHWPREDKMLCDLPELDYTWILKENSCFTRGNFYGFVKIEILSRVPGLFLYREFLTEKQVSDYVNLLKTIEFEKQEVVDSDGISEVSNIRVANGTTTIEDEHPEAASIMQTVRRKIPEINFNSAEDLSALSYGPGGHYAVHLDFLDLAPEALDEETMNFGDRLATLIMVFKKAEKGGATVFPSLGIAVRPNAGDAIFWFNMKGDLSAEELSYHAGCPIYKGNKIISSVWIRSKYQPVLDFAASGSIPASLMFR